MDETCPDSFNSIVLNLAPASSSSSAVAPSLLSNKYVQEDIQRNQPSTSSCHSSMSLLQEDFANSQHGFADEDLDDETTTSGVLETFEISSSNSLPPCSDLPVEVAVDDSSSTDMIKLVNVANSSHEFFNATKVYEINDDDDDVVAQEQESLSERANESTSSGNTPQLTTSSGSGVIVTNGGAPIFLETPVIEEQPHHPQIINLADGQIDFNEKNGKPKRLNDEFLLVGDAVEAIVEISDESIVVESTVAAATLSGMEGDESPATLNKSDSCNDANATADSNAEVQHDRMSFRLKKMNINNGAGTAQAGGNDHSIEDITTNDMPSSSHALLAPNMADIKAIDLIERREFEAEKKLMGTTILKASSLMNKNMLNLDLIKTCVGEMQKMTDDCPSSSSCANFKGRAVSSDSKCAYKDPSTTPTSSRNCTSRLTKSTAKINLCSTLSQPPEEHEQPAALSDADNGKVNLQPKSSTYSNSSSTAASSSPPSSVIVEAPTTSTCPSSTIGAAVAAEIFSNSNSNDSLIDGPSTTTTGRNVAIVEQTNAENQQKQKQQAQAAATSSSVVVDHERGCSRTSAVHILSGNASANACDEELDADADAQPSTSSARCQLPPPPRGFRQMQNASAQTIERYLSRTNGSFAAANPAQESVSNSVSNALATISYNSSIYRTRRNMAYASDIRMAQVMGAGSSAAEQRGSDFNDDSWPDCDENHSDLEEVCTCQHSSCCSSDSSHGGSSTSLNETDDFDLTMSKDGGDLSNYIQSVSISEEVQVVYGDGRASTASSGQVLQRKRKYNEGRILEGECGNAATGSSSSSVGADDGRKRIAYDYASTPRSSQSNALVLASTPTSQALVAVSGSPVGRRTPRSIIPTRENPPPELQSWLAQFQRWSHAERLLSIDRLIEHCEPTQVRHMMKVIEPQFQRDFISLLPRELALQVLAYLDPKDLLRAGQTCRSWRFLCDDNLLWKEKCRKAQILTEPRCDRPKRGRAGNMPPIASPWKAAYMRQHTIEMNWRSRPVRDPKVLKGHDDHVITCLQFSGNRIVSGSDDNTLKVWSAVTGRCLRTLVGHTGGVWSSQMSGNKIISGSTDRTLKVWDMETGQCLHTLLGHTSTVRCMHLHGNKVVSGSRDATLRVWDIEQGSCLHVLIGHLAAVRCVQYDGKLIVSGAYDYMVKIWHPERQECLHTLQGHTNRVYSLQFDGAHVVSGSLDTSIRVWDVETGNCKHTLMGHQSLTSGMELRQNILVSGNADSTVKVWDITTGQCLQTLSGPNKHQSAVTCLQFNSRFVVTSSDDGTVKLWDVKTGDFIRNLVALDSGGSGGVVWRIRANDTKLICAVGSRNGTEETKLMVLDFDVEGACVKCS